ncbi:MAG: hypothetical protein K9M99_07165 [Candidatus Cloacimonetes bacterium]|nr:hypothetical protein [Candidatus Cloacimonadota bacterium]
MIKQFFFEIIVGIVILLATYLFGMVGFWGFFLLAAYPFFFKIKNFDERELLLLHQADTLTLSMLLMVLILLYYFSGSNFGQINIGRNWLQFAVLSFLITHGASGIYIFRSDHEDDDEE